MPGVIQSVSLRTLPTDEIRQLLWRLSDRYAHQLLIQSARSVARGPVARLVAAGGRQSHDWTPEKATLLEAFDAAGLTSVYLDPELGGFIEGPKNLALALVAFELAWVDAGAATCSLAGHLALAPIHERGTPEQRSFYLARTLPPQAGEDRQVWRGAFCLTEPLPYVGVETGLLSGKVRVAQWNDAAEPLLQVEKRGRFITNMGFANFVTAAVESDDERIKGSCMVVLEETDQGVFDRGAPTRKLVHQLSSTNDPIFNLTVPASRIVGGYTVENGTIVPRYSHGEVIEAVFRRTRVTVGLMTAAKLLSAVEPVLRYQRTRFRGGESIAPGSPRYELGLQQREDALHRLVDVWATGEASASLGFATARLFDELDPLERRKEAIFAGRGVHGARAQMREMATLAQDAVEYLRNPSPDGPADELVRYALLDAVANVLCPAVKLWNTGHGGTMMREAVSLMGGYGITEDCPGFLGHKWMDAQLEATYEGPEAVQRRQLSVTMTNEVFLAQFQQWIREMRAIASRRPGTGACTIASAMELWLWTFAHLRRAADADGAKLYTGNRQGVTFPLADALCWLLAVRCQILDVLELEARAPERPELADSAPGYVGFFTNLCHVEAARAAGEVGRICAELVFGYNRHPAWDDPCAAGCCPGDFADELEGLIPGFGASSRVYMDVIESDGTHPAKAGPCVKFPQLQRFQALRAKLDGCLTGARLAKDAAAEALTKVMIPEAPDYPV
ncbi:MAG TPA: acyl-CoA dehydrogenase family protein [Vicinamibacterales bacterium]|nr:acyl-CoA dehydrogenase family protein [Vicinamibacterales bacterium]